MIPTLFEIPLPFGWQSLPVHSFGFSMVLCFLAAWRRLYISLEQAGEDPELAERMVTWAAIGGILGARVGYLISYPGEVISDPLGTIFGGAGFVFYGGFIGGALAVYILLRRIGHNFWRFSDIVAPCLAVGYAVGRVGCQLSGDGDYGMASDLPWAMSYALGVVPTPEGMLVHPAPVYESLMALLIAFVLVSDSVREKLAGNGQLFGLYLLLAAVARFLVEVVRIEPRVMGPLTQAQLVALALASVGIFLIAKSKRKLDV